MSETKNAYEVTFRAVVERVVHVEASSLAEAVRIAKPELAKKPLVVTDSLTPETVYEEDSEKGGLIVGACEACGVALIEGHSEYGYDEDGIYTCKGECVDGVDQ